MFPLISVLARLENVGADGGSRTPTALRPTDFLTIYGFRRPRRSALSTSARFVVWTIPSPYPGLEPERRCCPSSLYTFPSGTIHPGLARDCHFTGFPEFEQFCIAGFPREHSSSFKSVASTIPPRPRSSSIYSRERENSQEKFVTNRNISLFCLYCYLVFSFEH